MLAPLPEHPGGDPKMTLLASRPVVSLDDEIDQRALQTLSSLLSPPGAVRATTRVTPFMVSRFESLSVLPRTGYSIATCSGKLTALHSAALRRDPPVHLLALRDLGAPAAWEVEVLRSLLSGRSLIPSNSVRNVKATLTRVADIGTAASKVGEFSAQYGRGRTAVEEVVHEVCANALLDAPADAQGTPKYAFRRDENPTIAADDACTLQVSVANGRIYLTAVDRFGRLTPEPLANAVAGLGQKLRVNAAGGGGGMGMRRIIDLADTIAVRVRPGELTEFLAVVELTDVKRRAEHHKSVFFWVERG